MRRSIMGKSLLAMVMLSMVFGTSSVFAEGGYGIVYQGGEELSGENVTINAELVNGLTELLPSGTVTMSPNDAVRWESAYTKEGSECKQYNYLRLSNSNPITVGDGVGFNMSNDEYQVDVELKSAFLEGFSDDIVIAIGFPYGSRYFYAGNNAYLDSRCTRKDNSVDYLSVASGNVTGRVFTELNVKIRKKGQEELIISDGMYYNLKDIDGAQSFKILNEGNELTKDNMFALSEEVLQDTNPSTTLKNYYVPEGKYIYSDFANKKALSTSGTDVIVKLNNQTQENGLNIVYGFASYAGSGLVYYAKQYGIQYESDANGDLVGISSEIVLSGNSPSSSRTEPKEGYRLVGWTADKDVELADGTVVRAGEIVTLEQIRLVIVHDDIVFRATHELIDDGSDDSGDDGSDTDDDGSEELPPVVPNTGSNTDDLNRGGVGSSAIGILFSVLMIAGLYSFIHRR